jgi:glycosyltransferase involved in cell wall biosynthesis
VLILATRVPLESGDGTPSFILDNAGALVDEFDITILAPRIRASRPVSQQNGVTVRRFSYFPARWERLADDAIMPQLGTNPLLWLQAAQLVCMMLWHTIKEHRDRPLALIHANWIVPAGLVAVAMNRRYGIPYVTTSHGADAFRLNTWPLGAVKQAIVNRSSRFIGVSHDIVKQFPATRGPVEIQPVGTDFAAWEQAAERPSLSNGSVLFVGRLVAKKGVADAIRAVTQLANAELRIVGEGPLEQSLRMLAASSPEGERVVFLGRRNRMEVAQEMKSALCLVIPSVTAADGDRDGTPTVLGEAIAAGLPVVASNMAGLSEFIVDGETGRLHNPGDVQSLAEILQSFMNDPEAAAGLATEARARFASVFDLRQVSQRYADWYRRAITETKRQHSW